MIICSLTRQQHVFHLNYDVKTDDDEELMIVVMTEIELSKNIVSSNYRVNGVWTWYLTAPEQILTTDQSCVCNCYNSIVVLSRPAAADTDHITTLYILSKTMLFVAKFNFRNIQKSLRQPQELSLLIWTCEFVGLSPSLPRFNVNC